MTIATTLSDAADYIEENGWVTGTLRDEENGAVCAWGAIRAVTVLAPQEDRYGAVLSLSEAISQRGIALDQPVSRVVHWNDHVKGGKDTVVATMRRVAEQAVAA